MPKCAICQRKSDVSERGLCTKCELVRVELESKHEHEASKEYMKMNFTLQGCRINTLTEKADNLDGNVRGAEERLGIKMREIECRVEQNEQQTQDSVRKLDRSISEMQREINKLELQLQIALKQEETKKQDIEIEKLKLAQKKEETKQAKEKTRQELIRKGFDMSRDHNDSLPSQQYSEDGSVSEVNGSNQNLDFFTQQDYPDNWTKIHKPRTTAF